MTGCVEIATRREAGTDVFRDATEAAIRRYRLTAREGQVLEALLRGQERAQLAKAMAVSVATIKWHLHNLYRKLDVENGEAALRKVLGLDDPRWLRAPLQQRDALDRLVAAAEQVVQIRSVGRRTRLDGAVARLAKELAAVRLDAALTQPAVGDEQRAVVTPTTKDSRQLELPGSRP